MEKEKINLFLIECKQCKTSYYTSSCEEVYCAECDNEKPMQTIELVECRLEKVVTHYHTSEMRLAKVIEQCWGEDEETSKAYADLLLDHMSYDQADYLVNHDSYFNRYNGVESYADLVAELLDDEAFRAEEYKDYIAELEVLEEKGELDKEHILRADGWIVGFGVAVGICDNEIKEAKNVS